MAAAEQSMFYGWRVVAAAFVLAVFGWGVGFYGPPIYLHAVEEARGWPLAGFIRELTQETTGAAPWLFALAALIQATAIAAFLAPLRRGARNPR